MATRPFTADDNADDPSSEALALRSLGHHQLTVIAAELADVVRSTGGWLYDQARAGWTVNVRVSGRSDVRPLAILGASAVDADDETALAGAFGNGVLAVSAELLGSDARLRERISTLSNRGLTDVMVWGDACPAELDRHIEPVEYRLSRAARAFKGRALIAAGIDADPPAATETLFRLGAARPLHSV